MTANEVRDLISNELWQATAASDVKVKDFQALDAAVAGLTESEDRQEFKNYCEQCLEDKERNSIAVRYLATVTGRHPMDDRHIFTVLEQYYEESKWDEVIFLGNRILSFNESPYVLKVLAECYAVNDMTERKVEIWERLVKVDIEETEVLYKLADYYDRKGETQSALNYYRSIIRRHIKAHDLNALKNVWEKIMGLKGDNSEYLIGLASKIADTMGSEKGVYFLHSIYESGNFDINTNIEILKKIIRYAPHDRETRDMLVELWKEKYKDNPRLSYCLNNTGILDDYLNINIAIENFEKQIGFVEGAFVYHESWKLGRIMKISKDEMDIMFAAGGKTRTMTCKMAFSSLKVLPKRHIWVLKAAVNKEKLAAKFMSETEWGLRILLESYDNQASLKQMKAELVPAVLDDKQWTVWQTAAKAELSTNAYFGVNESARDVYVLRTTPISFEEKTLALFKATSDFNGKLRILKDFMARKGETDSDEFMSMVNYFESRAKISGPDGLEAFLVTDNLRNRYGMTFVQEGSPFIEYYNRLSDKKAFFESIQDSELKKGFVENIMSSVDNWQEVLVSLYPSYMTTYMADCIKKGPKKNAIYRILADSAASCKENPDFFLYLEKTFPSTDWAKAKVTKESMLVTKLSLLSFINRKIDNATNVADNKKRQKQLVSSLFAGEKEVYKYLDNADDAQAQKIFSILKGITGIENEKLAVKHYIASNFDNWEAITGENPDKGVDKKKIIPKGLLCTRAMLDAKAQELDHIMNVEIPENSREIGSARELGDLRENSEYQYGKDKQKNLNFLMNKLTDEVSSAQVINPENVDPTFVSFGTKVVFADNKAKADVTYTIFGPWESDPNRNILNFKAPLGQAIYNMEVGENRKFEINGVKYDYTVKSIEVAEF
ncbi:MAG: GreA/GreB family elongation factor [Spirochaetales bacterium]|nr:GreA/GreB family elongation factor [Spirochaetales bacterium]